MDVTEITGTDWHVGLVHDLKTIDMGKMYTLDFFAKADAKRNISLEVKRVPALGAWEGVTSATVNINEEWAEYSKTFTPGKDYPENASQICFWFGAVKGEVWLDGVRVYEGEKRDREGEIPEKSVEAEGKLLTAWAAVKARY